MARDKNPFTEYKLSHLNTKTIKRALSKNDILKIINVDCNNKSKVRQLAHDFIHIFLFMWWHFIRRHSQSHP